MARTLESKVALVTGSTSGIGLGIAEALAAEGADVVINGFGDADSIDQIRVGIERSYGVRCIYSDADMSLPAAIESMIEIARRKLGSIDILVNNAGIQHVAPIEEFPTEKWDAILAINLSSAFHCIRLALPDMRRSNWGRVINIASAHALVASPFKSAYVAAKHGINGLTKSVALEVAEQGVTVNAICPGYVMTPLVRDQIPDTAKARGISEEEVIRNVLLGAQPTKRFVEVCELGQLAVFLCSDAAMSITGVAIPVDGGWTSH